MKAIDELGVFWIPGHEEDPLSGRLTFDPSGGGINLVLVGTFDSVSDLNDESTTRIVGWAGADKVTLDDCYSSRISHNSSGIGESKYYANKMFRGCHLEYGDTDFNSVQVTLSDLENWVSKTGISQEFPRLSDRDNENLYTMQFKPLPEESRKFSRGEVKLSFLWESKGERVHEIQFRQWPTLKIEYSEPQPFSNIRKDVGRLQNLVTLCVDRYVGIDRMVLTRPDLQEFYLTGERAGHETPVDFFATPLRYLDPDNRKTLHPARMLLSYDELGGVAAIANWLDLSEKFQGALDSFMSVEHAKQMFAENRFLNIVFAAEAFHRSVYGDVRYLDEESFGELLNAALAGVPGEHQEWLRSRIEFGNEPPLRKRLESLASRSGEATRSLIGKRSQWAYTMVQVRNHLTHVAGGSDIFRGHDLILLAKSLYAVVRICMLLEIPVSREILADKANAWSIVWYGERLRESIENVRRQFGELESKRS